MRTWICSLTLIGSIATSFAGPADDMKAAADLFIQTLDKDQKSKALFAWDEEFRNEWYFVPDRNTPQKVRRGLRLEDMKPHQRPLAHGLLNAALSQKGYLQAMQVMMLEQILHELENNAAHRNPAWYYVTLFGTPSTSKSWSFRYEGHHLSINVTLVDGQKISMTPTFFGSNPGQVKEGPHEGLQVLLEEEHYARKLALTLTGKQKKAGILETKAPRDVLTKQNRKAERKLFEPATGVRADQLNESQQAMLKQLIGVYTGKARAAVEAQILARKPAYDPAKTRFTWIGDLAVGAPHYYRIETGDHLFEYDNTQNGANHVHAVWRGFDGDFGEDLLGKHVKEAHGE